LFAKIFDLVNVKDEIKKEIMWTIKNICMTGTPLKVVEFIQDFKLLDIVVAEL
jgi:hypothetical protein